MLRVLDFSLPGYPSPEGAGDKSAYPLFDWKIKSPLYIENICKERPISDILGEYYMRTFLLGPFRGELFNLGVLSTKPHTTYASFFNREQEGRWNMQSIAELDPEKFIGKLKVIEVDVENRGTISLKQIQDKCQVNKDDIVIIKTGYSKKRKPKPTSKYYTNSPGLDFLAAKWLIEKKIKSIVTDMRNLEPVTSTQTKSLHELFNSSGILVVEDATNLDNISESHDYLAVGIPVKIFGATGGPARVIAFELKNPENFVDLSHPLDFFPEARPNYDIPFDTPLPERIEPRNYQNIVAKWTRLTPFLLKGKDVRGPNNQSIEMYMHFSHATGTHAEAAYFDAFGEHNIPEAILKKYVRMPLERLVGNAVLMDLSKKIGPRQQITLEHVKEAAIEIKKGDILFVKTEINDWYLFGKSIDITPGFTLEAAKWLVDQGIKAIVIDFPSVEMSNPSSGVEGIRYTSNKVHYYFHRNDIPVVEKPVKFRLLRKNRFKAIILPLQTSNLGGFPVHVLVLEEWK